jgi:hypothetical protein
MRKKIALIIGSILGVIAIFFLIKNASRYFDSDLAGVDANHDGVRDDVEALINENYSDENIRIAARHLHQGIQAAILDPAGHDTNMILCSAVCLVYRLNGQPYSGSQIEAWTANTRARIKQYLKAEARDNGKIIGCHLDDEEACRYETPIKR